MTLNHDFYRGQQGLFDLPIQLDGLQMSERE